MEIKEAMEILEKDIHTEVPKAAISARKHDAAVRMALVALKKADSSKADYLRRTERRYRLRMLYVWQTGNVGCGKQRQLLWRMWL